MSNQTTAELLARLDTLTHQELKRYLVQELTRKKLGLVWESDLIERDTAINANLVFPQLVAEQSLLDNTNASGNLIIEGDNFDALRLLKATHAGKIRVILIDPPYNTGNKDWVYNDTYLKKDNRWKHSTWLEFMYQRMVLARDLLTPDGVILICINDENRSRLELMMDEVMPGRRVGGFVWKVRSGGNDTGGALFSDNHEHVLIYANPSFEFNGLERDESAFSNPDNDSRGPWANGDLVQSKNARQRPESYYPIQNPDTGVWYACDPDSVWRFASKYRESKKTLQAAPIEDQIAEGKVLWPANEKTVTYQSLKEIQAAIKSGKAPKQLKIYTQIDELELLAQTDAKVARLLSYLEPLEVWVGRTIGYGKPRYKRFRQDLKRDVRPVSSWLHPQSDGVWVDDEDEHFSHTLTVGSTGEGTRQYKEILNNKDFPYPKPLSLLQALLEQATHPNDTILDFFAGSGTTGQAVLALNNKDGGTRKFILCSSTEATSLEPNKNLCRDICAERIRRVIKHYGKTDELDGDFAYARLIQIEEADLLFDATPEHTYAILTMRETGQLRLPKKDDFIWPVASSEHAGIVVCPILNEDTIAALKALPVKRLVAYTDRPERLREAVASPELEVITYSLEDALRWGQIARTRDIPDMFVNHDGLEAQQ